MSLLRTLFVTALLGLSLSVGTLQAAEPPSPESVQQSLDKIADRKLPEADQKALQGVLQQTLSLLGDKADYEQRLTDIKQQLATAPGSGRPTLLGPARPVPAGRFGRPCNRNAQRRDG